MKGRFATQEMLDQSVQQFDKNAPTTAENAAQQILNAVETNKKRLLIGNDAKLIDLIIRLFPVSFTKIFIKQMEKAFTNPYKN